MSFFAEVRDKNDRLLQIHPSLDVQIRSYRWSAAGGPASANINVMGPQQALFRLLEWLGYHIVIKNDYGTAVWWGFVDEISINLSGISVGASLSEVANKVMADYSYDIPGGSVEGTVDWSTDDDSIDRFGTREKKLTLTDMTETAATQRVAAELERYGRPRAVPSLGGSDSVEASIVCAGYYSTFKHFYVENLKGLDGFTDVGSNEAALGWTMGPKYGILFSRKHNRIGDIDLGFTDLPETQQIRVSGSTGNNRSFIVGEAADVTEEVEITFSDVDFQQQDDVYDRDADPMFDLFTKGNPVYITGTDGGGPHNDGYWVIKDIPESAYMTLYGNEISANRDVVNQDAQAPTITQGNSVGLTENVTGETEGNDSVTITADGLKIAQSFTLTNNTDDWALSEVWIHMRKAGSPVDNVTVKLYSDSSGPDTLLDTSDTVAGSSISNIADWVQFTFDTDVDLSYGTTYWLVIERSGSATTGDFYLVTVNEDYDSGTLRLWSGSSYVARGAGDASISYQIWGHETIDNQIIAIANENEWIEGYDSTVNGTELLPQYQEGDNTADEVLDDLLRTAPDRWLITVDQWRRLLLAEAPASTEIGGYITNDGRIKMPLGRQLEPGVVPCGIWLALEDVPSYNDDFVGINAQFVEACEYDVDSGQLKPEFIDDFWRVN